MTVKLTKVDHEFGRAHHIKHDLAKDQSHFYMGLILSLIPSEISFAITIFSTLLEKTHKGPNVNKHGDCLGRMLVRRVLCFTVCVRAVPHILWVVPECK